MTARVLVVDDVLPNVKLLEARLSSEYFHVVTAYDILRHNGVEVGKRDYLGPVPTLA